MQNTYKAVKANFKDAKVFIAEDNDDQWLFIERAMRECLTEITPQRVSTIEQALRLMDEWRYQEWEIPKLFLLDLYFPTNSEGWQLLKQIKAMSTPINQIPIVMLTCSVDPADIMEAYQLGISAYMIKPTGFDEWLTCFRELRTYWWETVTLPPTEYRM